MERWGGQQEPPAEGMLSTENIASFELLRELLVSVMPPRPYEGGTLSTRLYSVFLLPVMCCVIGRIIPPSQEPGEWNSPCGGAPRTGPVMGLCSVKGVLYLYVIDQEIRSVHFSLRG